MVDPTTVGHGTKVVDDAAHLRGGQPVGRLDQQAEELPYAETMPESSEWSDTGAGFPEAALRS